MSTPETNIKVPRKPSHRWTEKRIAELRAQCVREGYDEGHADGWKDCQRTKSNPLADMAIGAVLAYVPALLLWWWF